MAEDNTLTIIGAISFIFILVMLLVSLAIFSPPQDKMPLSISNPIQEEITDLFTLPRYTIDTSICYETISCLNALKEEETTLEEFKLMGLELNCDQIPCYVQGVNYHA